jgi:lipopolysaccharide biosynthesis regulator YciM
MRSRLWIAVPALLIAASAALAQETPERKIEEIDQLLKDNSSSAIQRAIGLAKDFLDKHKDHSQVDEVRFRLAKCYNIQGLEQEQIAELKLMLDSKTKSRSRPQAYYMLGKAYGALHQHDKAVVVFEKMLSEGAGLLEEEARFLCGGYYEMLEKYDDAAAKYNLVKRLRDGKYARPAAQRLALLWLKAKKPDRAAEAIRDLAEGWPQQEREHAELFVNLADTYRLNKEYDKAIAVCEETAKYAKPGTVEDIACRCIRGQCLVDQGKHDAAVKILEPITKFTKPEARTLAATAALQCAELYYDKDKLNNPAKSMDLYEQTFQLTRDSELDVEVKARILQRCALQLGQYYYQAGKLGAAREWFLQYVHAGGKQNVLPIINEIAKKLNIAETAPPVPDAKTLQDIIKERPGTPEAFEAEWYILMDKLQNSMRVQASAVSLAKEYEQLFVKYPKDVINEQDRVYILWQIAACYGTGTAKADLLKAIDTWEKLAGDEKTPKEDRSRALQYIITVTEKNGALAKPPVIPDATLKEKHAQATHKLGLLVEKDFGEKSGLKNALQLAGSLMGRIGDDKELLQKLITTLKQRIEDIGPLAAEAGEARYQLAELYYMNRQWGNAANAFKEFVRLNGPKQDADGNVLGGPWRPQLTPQVEKVYEAAIRMAHCWYRDTNRAERNKTYQWIAKNLPHQNRWMAEVQYYLAKENERPPQPGVPVQDNDLKLADALWTNVINPSKDPDDPNFKKSFHWWTGLGEDEPAGALSYVKAAILQSGKTYGKIGRHQDAAMCYEQYLALYDRPSGGKNPRTGEIVPDPNAAIARYALGQEYIALGRIQRMIQVYKPYLDGLREDPFRSSVLMLVGFNASQNKLWEPAIDAYAALLDEYGENELDKDGKPKPLPSEKRLRPQARNWNGIRKPLPKNLKPYEIRYSMGLVYWRQEDYRRCAVVLQPFLDYRPPTESDKEKEGRGIAMFMAGQSYLKTGDYASAAKILARLITEFPKFGPIEEAYEYTARSYIETKQWESMLLLHRTFRNEWQKSPRMPRIEFYYAMALQGAGRGAEAAARLKALADANDADPATRADAAYHLALPLAGKDDAAAMRLFEKSIKEYARDVSCLAGGKCAMRLKNWERARELLERAHEFPQGNPAVSAEAKELLPGVLKYLTKPPKK